MKSFLHYTSLKVSLRFLGIFIFLLFQNCTVYRGTSVSADNAIEQDTKVVLVTNDGTKLKFKKLLKDENDLVGVAKKRKTLKYLDEQGIKYSDHGRMRHYLLDSLEVSEIYPKNKPVSTIVTVVVTALVTFTVLVISAGIIIFSSWGG